MKLPKLFFLLLALIAISCNSDDVTSPEIGNNNKGDLLVTVKSNSGSPVKGATVIITETGEQSVSDAYGQALFRNISQGTHEIIAFVRRAGSGKTIVKVIPQDLNKTDLIFYNGIFLEPSIQILSPASYYKYTPSDTVLIKATIKDIETRSDSIKVEITNNNDPLAALYPDINGNVEFKTTTLKKGYQKIYIKATNKAGYFALDSTVVSNVLPPKVTLEGTTDNNTLVSLKWSVPNEPDFLRYEIYRSESNGAASAGKLIKPIYEKNNTVYTDTITALTGKVYYQILTYNKEGEKSISNEIYLADPAGKIYSYTLKDVIMHPVKPWLYLLDTKGMIHIFDFETKTMKLEKTFSSSANFMEIGDNGYGIELYLPQDDGWIKILDDETLTQKQQINCGTAVKSVVIDGNGHVFASIRAWTNKPLRSYDRATGALISSNGDFESCRLRMLPSKAGIIEISTSVSPTDMEYYKIDSKGNILKHFADTQHGDYALSPDIFRVSPSGDLVITSTNGSMYKADSTMRYLGTMPRGSSSYSDFAFNESGSLVFAGCSNERRIRLFSNPGFLESMPIVTKGYPYFICRKGNMIISVSKTTYSDWWNESYNFAIEVLYIE